MGEFFRLGVAVPNFGTTTLGRRQEGRSMLVYVSCQWFRAQGVSTSLPKQ